LCGLACGLCKGQIGKNTGQKIKGENSGGAFCPIAWACFLFVGIACRVYCKLKAIYQHLAVKNICQVLRERTHPTGGA
jgi:hypothetical protein